MRSNISNSLSKITKIISLFLVTVISLTSCSLDSPYNPFSNREDEIKNHKANKLVKCPKAFLPKETLFFKSLVDVQTISFKIKKMELICKEENIEGKLKSLQIDYKAHIYLDRAKKTSKKVKFPNIYFAIINEYSDYIMLKVLAEINNKNTQKAKLSNEFIHKNSFRINYKNGDLEPTGYCEKIPTPVCILPVKFD